MTRNGGKFDLSTNRGARYGSRRGPNEDLVLVPVGLAFRSMLRAFDRDTGVSAPRWFILSMLAEEDGLSQGELCRRFDQDPSGVTRLAPGLATERLIRRERDPEDNRVVRMYLTDEGHKLVSGFPERLVGFERGARSAMSDAELRELERLTGIPIIAVALLASMFIKELPLRTRTYADEPSSG
jgi:DNA-binding MarR family transcriptional regulator